MERHEMNRKSGIHMAVAALLSLSPVAVAAQSGPGMASERIPPILRSEAVPITDLRDASAEAVRQIAMREAGSAPLVVFYGEDLQAFESTIRGIRQARSRGAATIRILLAPPIGSRVKTALGSTSATKIEIFAEGRQIADVPAEGFELETRVRDALSTSEGMAEGQH